MTLLQDFRFAIRQLVRQRGVSIVAVLTLALGIGANTAVFTVFYRAILRPLPVAQPERLVHLVLDRGRDGISYNLSYAGFDAYRTKVSAFTGIAGHTSATGTMQIGGNATLLQGAAVSSGFFATLRAPLLRGRDFLPEEERVGGEATIVLSYGLARRIGNPDTLIGKPVRLNGQPFMIVGIAAPSFNGLVAGGQQEFWITFGAYAKFADWIANAMRNGRASWIDAFARIRDGRTLAQASAELTRFDAEAVAAKLRDTTTHSRLLEGSHGLTYVASSVKRPLKFLMAVVALVLVLACANIANLLLLRAEARRREIAIRLALGARRARLVRQLLTESFALAFAGGAAGLLVAYWGVQFLVGYAPSGHAALAVATDVDGPVLAFAAAMAVTVAFVFGLIPALRASSASLIPALKGAQRPGSDRLFGLRGGLVVAQVAISLVLVTAAALFTRSVQNLSAVDVGFGSGKALLASLDLESAGYDAARGKVLVPQILDRLKAIPGVEYATAAAVITPNPGGSNWGGVRIEGYTPPADQPTSFDVNRVAPDYFEALGVRVVAGRALSASDMAGAPTTIVVNETFARKYFNGENAVGRHIYLGDPPNERAIAIVGVAHDGKYRDVREAEQANVYMSMLQAYVPAFTLVLRSSGDPRALSTALRREIRAIDPGLALYDVKTLAQHIESATAQDRMIATLSTMFGLTSLALAALGLFGVVAYSVAQRTRDIGVRVALGARESRVVGMIISRGGALVGAGLVAGMAVAVGLGRFADSMLFGLHASDPTSFGVAALVLMLVGLVAAWIPARRAARVDPVVALRSE